MNDKETELYRIVDSVVSCCATQIDADGHVNLTAEDVLGKSRAEPRAAYGRYGLAGMRRGHRAGRFMR